MRSDMAQVIVERPRVKAHKSRMGRRVDLEELPSHEGMRRGHALRGERKELNENLQPLRRYLERQVGRPWRKVYAEISQNLRVSSTVQQHVRDHLGDFVAVKPRRIDSWRARLGGPWWQPFYVDPASGLLCRTDRLPEVKARRRGERNRPPAPVTRVALGKDSELHLLAGLWYHVRLAPLPEPVYLVCRETQRRFRKGYSARGGFDEVEVEVGQLVTWVTDAVTGERIPAGPRTDDTASWNLYRRTHPNRFYAVAKRALSRRELRRHGLRNSPPEES